MPDIFAADVSEWLDMAASSITINSWTGRNVSNVPTYNPVGVSYTCYIEMKNHLIVNALGREILAKGRVFIIGTPLISTKDKITLPAAYVPTSPPILAVNLADDERGVHHTTLEIG